MTRASIVLLATLAGLAAFLPRSRAADPNANANANANADAGADAGTHSLRVSVYATAGDILQHLAPAGNRARVLDQLASLGVARVFLEGRRGDEYVPPATLAEVRDFLATHGLASSGGIATVPGSAFGTRQQGPLGWLNWESQKTRSDVAGFFRENAPVFDELIVDDFYCTGDTSPESDRARGDRTWGDYRRDLLVGLIPPLILQPTRAVRPEARLILKFPQWYDRFHLFGYDPFRMAAPFDAIWVGTEVRNPLTRRMGFVQPTEGYVNFSWLRSVIGPRVVGAWFDHIECTPQNFVDQAYLGVLAGARELTLFRLGDVMENHPGDRLLATHLPALRELAGRVRPRETRRRGIPFYKPPGSDAADNLYLMDYLAMMGWPVLPVAAFPTHAPVLCLGAQSAADPAIASRLRHALDRGATVLVTPAFLRQAGPDVAAWAGLEVAPDPAPGELPTLLHRRTPLALETPLQVDAAVKSTGARTVLAGTPDVGTGIPVLTTRREGRGRIVLVNLRTFSEADFREAGEWLLAPRALGCSNLPSAAADTVRREVLEPLGIRLQAPGGVALHLFDDAACLYSFLPHPVDVRWNGRHLRLAAHECRWLP